VDPAWEADDPAPGVADILAQIWTAIRHPRAFLRSHTRRAV